MKGVLGMPKTKIDELMEEYVHLENANRNLNLYLQRVETICKQEGNGLWGALEQEFDGMPGYTGVEDEEI